MLNYRKCLFNLDNIWINNITTIFKFVSISEKLANPANVPAKHMPFISNNRQRSMSGWASRLSRPQTLEWIRGTWATPGCLRAYVCRHASIVTSNNCHWIKCQKSVAKEHVTENSRSHISYPNRISRWSTASTWKTCTRHPMRIL